METMPDRDKPQNAPFEARWVVKTFDSIRPIDCISIKKALIRLSRALSAGTDSHGLDLGLGGDHTEVTLP